MDADVQRANRLPQHGLPFRKNAAASGKLYYRDSGPAIEADNCGLDPNVFHALRKRQ